MSKGNSDVLLIGALAVGAMFIMSRSRTAMARPVTGLTQPVRIGNTAGMPWGGFTGASTGRVIGSIVGGSQSPDIVANGSTTGGATVWPGGFNFTAALGNASDAVAQDVSGGMYTDPTSIPYDWSQWFGAVGGPQGTGGYQFALPANSM